MFQCNTRVAILMATFNGEKYIEEQIRSITNQSYTNWTLYIRDDGSTDQTINIVQSLAKDDNRIVICPNTTKYKSPLKNFMNLLEDVDAELYMFSDQDDYWLGNKVLLSVEAYDNVPNHDNIPCVVHTNVSLVDTDLKMKVESRWQAINLNPNKLKKYEFIAQCCYTQGATMLFNQKAKQVSFPVASYAHMHDWWVATRCIKNNGTIISVNTPTMLYRQHSANVLGVSYSRNILGRMGWKSLRKVLKDNFEIYQTLKQDGYGLWLKFLYYKIYLMIHMSIKNK